MEECESVGTATGISPDESADGGSGMGDSPEPICSGVVGYMLVGAIEEWADGDIGIGASPEPIT